MASKAKKKPAKKLVKQPAKKVIKKNTKKVATKKTAKKSVKKTAKPVAKAKVKKAAAKKAVKPTKVVKKLPAKKAVAVKAVTKVKNIDYSKAFTPLADRLVIRLVQGEKVTAGGIIIPDMVSSALGHLKGEVLAVGQGAKNKKGAIRPLDVKVGDQVLFAEYAGTKIVFNSEDLQIIHESDVMGIVQK